MYTRAIIISCVKRPSQRDNGILKTYVFEHVGKRCAHGESKTRSRHRKGENEFDGREIIEFILGVSVIDCLQICFIS